MVVRLTVPLNHKRQILEVFARISQKELRHITHVLETLTGI